MIRETASSLKLTEKADAGESTIGDRYVLRSHSGKGGDSGIDTRVYCCPIPLGFRKRVVYSSYAFKVNLKTF